MAPANFRTSVSPGDFVVGPAPTNPTQRIIYNSSTGALLYDPNGNGAAARAIRRAVDRAGADA
jgi:hypothetical protein